MIGSKALGARRIVLIVLSVIAVAAAWSMYVRGYFDWWLGEFASGAGKINPAACGKAGISIDSVSCADKVVRIAFSNTGRVPLNGNFLAAVSTDRMQAFAANVTESAIMPGRSGSLLFELDLLEGPIWKAVLTFQECKDVMAEKDKLSITC